MNKSRVYSLDVLRVLCTLCLFLCHASFLLPATLNDYIGALTGFVLELFFILSGFVTMVAWKQPQGFFIKKVKKVWPLHFIMYIACFVLQYLYNPQVWSFSDSVKQTAVNLLFLQSWTPNETYVYSYNGVTWFLSSLFFCYLFTPVFVRFILKHIKHAGVILAAIISIRFLYVTSFNSFIGEGGFCYTNVFPLYRFLEYARYVGNSYGTPVSLVEDNLNAGKDVILEIELQGAMQVKEIYPDALTVFVVPPDAETLKNRLVGRGTETEEVICERLKRAGEEADQVEWYEYIIVNDKLETSVASLHGLIQSTKNRTLNNIEFINEVKEGVKAFSKGE